MTVGEILARQKKPGTSCRQNDNAADILRIMTERDIKYMPVVEDNGEMVGIITFADIAGELSKIPAPVILSAQWPVIGGNAVG